MWTIVNTSLTSFTCFRMIHMGMAMREKDSFPKYVVRTYFHTFPTSLAPAIVELDILRDHMSSQGQGKMHLC